MRTARGIRGGAGGEQGRRGGVGSGGGVGIDCLVTSADDVANPGLREIGG
jgi:hypothetical protein